LSMKFYYLIRFQYLGFRYHGWLKQTADAKTIQGTLETALTQYLESSAFQVLGSSRTDSIVSAKESFFELITEKEVMLTDFPDQINRLLPPDIKILDAIVVDGQFKIISSPREKEYRYYFAFGGEKLHPFCAPFMAMINENLELEKMEKAAELFIGEHNFFRSVIKNGKDKILSAQLIILLLKPTRIFREAFFLQSLLFLL
jgi:tRNA pseudouridine38-40 synthase